MIMAICDVLETTIYCGKNNDDNCCSAAPPKAWIYLHMKILKMNPRIIGYMMEL